MRTLNSNAIPRQLLIPTRYQGLAWNGTVSGVPYAAEFQFIPLWQHRTIASASLRRLFAPLLPFEKPEIHTGFLRFPNFELGQKSCLRLLAELRGAALYEKRLRLSGRESEALWENRSYPHRRDARIFAHWVSSFCVVNSSQVWQLCMAEAMTMPGIPW